MRNPGEVDKFKFDIQNSEVGNILTRLGQVLIARYGLDHDIVQAFIEKILDDMVYNLNQGNLLAFVKKLEDGSAQIAAYDIVNTENLSELID